MQIGYSGIVFWRRIFGVLFLGAIAAAAGYVWFTYQQSLAKQASNSPPPPPPLAETLSSSAEGFIYVTSDGGRTIAELRAKSAKETKSPPHTELEKMELRLFHPDGTSFDLIRADRGEFYPAEGRLSSEEMVEVRLAVPLDEDIGGRLLEIRAQGASLEIKTGKMQSSGAVQFRFHQPGGEGSGTAVGAEYDPQTRQLFLQQKANLLWTPRDRRKAPISVESEQVRYAETESKVYLSPWAKMKKAGFTLTAKESEVLLENGIIRDVVAREAVGTDKLPQRQVDYAAQSLRVEFAESGAAQKVTAEGEAKLLASGPSGRTRAAANRMDLTYRDADGNSVLEKALATGKAEMENAPRARGGQQSETKLLRSEVIEMWMKPGGEEIDRVETHAAGTLDFLPNHPRQRKRHLDAERIRIDYAANNQIREFRAVNAATRTDPAAMPKRNAPPMFTWSKDLLAKFDPKTGDVTEIEQWNDFRYQEGDRRAKAAKAVQAGANEQIELTGDARVWDATTSTDAQRIVFQPQTGDFDAFGQVRSSRREGSQGAANAQPATEVTQATAKTMRVREENNRIEYEGDAVLWKGENRLRAERIEIHSKKGTLDAFGQVTHQMLDSKSAAAQKDGPLLTKVTAKVMHYSDQEKYVEYQGGVELVRPNLNVKSQRLRAYLNEENATSSAESPNGEIEKIFAYGKVDIVEKGKTRTRTGRGETGEYYTADGKLLLEGGNPLVIDVDRGVEKRRTTGKQLLWYANADRLIVDGSEDKPVLSTITRKK